MTRRARTQRIRGGGVRAASPARGIRGLGQRAQGRALGAVLHARALRLRRATPSARDLRASLLGDAVAAARTAQQGHAGHCCRACCCCWTGGRSAASRRARSGGAGGPHHWRRAVLEKLPMFLLVAAAAPGSRSSSSVAAGAHGIRSHGFSLGERACATRSKPMSSTRRSSFWPSGLAVFYPHALGAAAPFGRASRPGCSSSACRALGRAVRRASGRISPSAGSGIWVMLVPMIGLVQVGLQSRADRYMYLPLIGLSIMVAWGACDAARAPARAAPRHARGARRPRRSLGLHVAPAAALAELLHVVRAHPGRRAGERRPPSRSSADAYLRRWRCRRRGASLRAGGRRSIPDWTPPRLGLADVRACRGDLAGAIAAYERELRRNPSDTLAAGRYGFALLRAGRGRGGAAPRSRWPSRRIRARCRSHVALAVVYDQLGRVRGRDPQQSRGAAARPAAGAKRRTTSPGSSPRRAEATPAERQEADRMGRARQPLARAVKTPPCSIRSPSPTPRRAASTRRPRRRRAR